MPLDPTLNAILPKYSPPRFPDRCVSCGQLSPRDTLTIYTSLLSNEIHISSLWRRHSVEVPVCAGCRANLIGKRRLMRIALLMFAMLFVAYFYWVFEVYGGKHDKALFRIGAMMALLPLILLWTMLRMPASMEEEGGHLGYWFENREFDREFRELNGIRAKPDFDFLEDA